MPHALSPPTDSAVNVRPPTTAVGVGCPCPQQYAAPLVARPQASESDIDSDAKEIFPTTGWGLGSFITFNVPLPRPSMPPTFSPQQYAAPLAMSPQVLSPPPAIACNG